MAEFSGKPADEVLQSMTVHWHQRAIADGDCNVETALLRAHVLESGNNHVPSDLLRSLAYGFVASRQGSEEGDAHFKKLLPGGEAAAGGESAGSTDSWSLASLYKQYVLAVEQDSCKAAAVLASLYSTGCAGVVAANPLLAFQWQLLASKSRQEVDCAIAAAETLLEGIPEHLPADVPAALGLLGAASQQGAPSSKAALLRLGLCAAQGTGMPSSRMRALLFWNASEWEGPAALLAQCKAAAAELDFSPEEKEYEQRVADARRRRNADALFQLGALAYQGRGGFPTDNELAHVLFSEAAVHEHPRAMSQLGFMAATGRGCEKSEPIALDWLRRSAEAGHGTSMFNYAKQCEEGRGLPGGKPDFATAVEWYERAAAGPYPMAIHNLSLALIRGHGGEERRAEGFDMLKAAADPHGRNLLSAQASLGMLLEDGRPQWGIERDATEAARWLALAAEGGRSDVALRYARCFLWGRGVSKSLEDAEELLMEAMQHDKDEEAAKELIHWSVHGVGGFPVSGAKVLEVGQLAAEQKMWSALWKAMFALSNGSSKMPAQPQDALELCRAGLQSGDSNFAAHLSFCLYTGHGCEVDFEGARAASLQAAESSDDDTAMSNLAEMLWQGLGGPQDVDGALSWWRKAAADTPQVSSHLALHLAEEELRLGLHRDQPSVEEQTAAAALGDAQAVLWLLHRAFNGGLGVASDNDELARVLLQATNNGTELMPGLPAYVWSMHSCVQDSRSHSVPELPASRKGAAKSLLRAAESGCRFAAYCAGVYYARGVLVTKRVNMVEAARWLRAAHNAGYTMAATYMRKKGITFE